MNKLLQRQIRKHLAGLDPIPEYLLPLFESISQAYDGFEIDSQLMQRSLDISSREMRESNLQELRRFNLKLQAEIEEREQAERRQTLLLEEVMRANDELTHFAYVTSHDLKRPLRGISLAVEWICIDHGETLTAEVREQLDLVLQRARCLYDTIEALLEYVRLRPTQAIRYVSLDELARDALSGLSPPDAVTVTIENELPMIACDPRVVGQIFDHLLGNAIKFMDKDQGLITIRCEEQADHWLFRVQDNGPGIEAHHFERIFRIFQTLEQTESSRATGVGLALVKKAVEIHDGEIKVESKIGEGTTFLFTLSKHLKVEESASADRTLEGLLA